MMDRQDLAVAHQLLTSRVGKSHWENPEQPETVQAMQIALHIPKDVPPVRHDLLAAAARAVVQVCLDPRAAQDPEYRSRLEAWYDHLIRKVARRARNKNWLDAQTVAGVTAEVGSAQARAFLPSPVSEVPPELKKLQIQGTELPREDAAEQDTAVPELPRIYLDAGLAMTTGKAAAQAGHGAMLLAAHRDLDWVWRWAQRDFALTVAEVDSALFAGLADDPDAVAVRDAGFTEVAPDSKTVLALPGRI